MSELRINVARPYAFPTMTKLEEAQLAADRDGETQLEVALNDAIAEGIAKGVEQGRLEAQIEARQLLEQSRHEGFQSGHAEGLDEMRQASSALQAALEEFADQRTQLISEVEGFCVDLALAIVGRLVEADSVRTEFVVRSVKAAQKAFAPENLTAIFLNPKVSKSLKIAMQGLPVREDDNLATGSARVEIPRLLVQSSIDEAFEQIRGALIELKVNRHASLRKVRKQVKRDNDASDL